MRVVRLGAWCDVVTEEDYRRRFDHAPAVPEGTDGAARPGLFGWASAGEAAVTAALADFRRGASFDVQEFAVLADGRRLTLHAERGFTVSGPAEVWAHLTRASLERDVRTTVLPDEDSGEEHPWEWLASLVRAHGVACSGAELRQVPYEVVLSPRLLERLREA